MDDGETGASGSFGPMGPVAQGLESRAMSRLHCDSLFRSIAAVLVWCASALLFTIVVYSRCSTVSETCGVATHNVAYVRPTRVHIYLEIRKLEIRKL